jgi:hypothetical protein
MHYRLHTLLKPKCKGVLCCLFGASFIVLAAASLRPVIVVICACMATTFLILARKHFADSNT